MIAAISPFFLGSRDSIYDTAGLISSQGIFQGYYSMDIAADTAKGAARELFARSGIVPVSFRMVPGLDETAERFHEALPLARELIEKAAQAGYQTATTWILPGSNTLHQEAYHTQMIERLQIMSELLAPYNIPLGVELVAPETMRREYRYPIGCRTTDLLALLARVGRANVGVCMDCFHAYCTGQPEAEYGAITDVSQLVIVHISDAVRGVPPSEQQDQDRRLPGESGVIDCAQVFDWLRKLNYQGAVVLEPIDARFEKQGFAKSLQQAGEAVRRVWPGDRND